MKVQVARRNGFSIINNIYLCEPAETRTAAAQIGITRFSPDRDENSHQHIH